jgi:hypothetical protein
MTPAGLFSKSCVRRIKKWVDEDTPKEKNRPYILAGPSAKGIALS